MNEFFADVKLAQEGSTDAFARLYALVYEDMYHIALYNLRSTHDAADTVSEAVLDAFCSIKKLREPDKFRSWIMRILAIKIKRKQRDYFDTAEEFSDEIKIDSFDFDSVELRDTLDKLNNESKMILSMSVLGGYTSDEIAKICYIKASTVRSKLARIKKHLRLELE